MPSTRTIVAEDMGVGVIVRQIDRHVFDNAIFSFRTAIEDDGLLGLTCPSSQSFSLVF